MNAQDSYVKRNLSNSMSVVKWSMLWAVTLVIAAALNRFMGPLSFVIIAGLIIVHLVFAFGALKAHQVWLRGLDEFQKQIQLHSMAFTLGMTWIAVILMMLLSSLDLIEIGQNHLVFLSVYMAVVGAIGTLFNNRKSS